MYDQIVDRSAIKMHENVITSAVSWAMSKSTQLSQQDLLSHKC